MEKSKTFVNKRGLVPEFTVNVWDHDPKKLQRARESVRYHARDGTELQKFLEMIGIEEGVENDPGPTIVCHRSA